MLIDQGWYLTLLSSGLCVAGCFIICLDLVYLKLFPSYSKKHQFKLNENNQFLVASLSLSSGCLIFTSLYKLLPESYVYFEKSSLSENTNKNLILMVFYLCGIIFCSVFNGILHLLTSQSVVHCNHGDQANDSESMISQESTEGHSHSHSRNDLNENSHTHSHTNTDCISNESTPLVTKSPKSKKSIVDITLGRLNHIESELAGECKGYTSAEACINSINARLHYCELPQSQLSSVKSNPETHIIDDHSLISHNHGQLSNQIQNQNPFQNHVNHPSHHHHVTTPVSRLLLIGIQTTMAITLHKLPEGFITYVTSRTNPKLGLNIFLSLTIHNFTEGFSMCLPLYYSLDSRVRAILIAGSLGGLSQPFGALLGYIFLEHEKKKNRNSEDYLLHLNFVFGISLAITSGFLTIISLQMFSSSISFGGSQRFVTFWCIFGISIIGFSAALTQQ